MHRTKPMGARSLLDSRSMVSAWCRSIQIERNQKSFVCKNMNSGSFVRVSSFAGSMLATIHSLKTCTKCSRMRSLLLEIVRAAATLSNVRNLSLRYRIGMNAKDVFWYGTGWWQKTWRYGLERWAKNGMLEQELKIWPGPPRKLQSVSAVDGLVPKVTSKSNFWRQACCVMFLIRSRHWLLTVLLTNWSVVRSCEQLWLLTKKFLCPNLRNVIRDKAHNSRRLTSRPYRESGFVEGSWRQCLVTLFLCHWLEKSWSASWWLRVCFRPGREFPLLDRRMHVAASAIVFTVVGWFGHRCDRMLIGWFGHNKRECKPLSERKIFTAFCCIWLLGLANCMVTLLPQLFQK